MVGEVVAGQVKKVLPHEGLLISLPGHTGRVDITDISDHYTDNPLSGFHKSQLIRCVCVCVSPLSLFLSLSLLCVCSILPLCPHHCIMYTYTHEHCTCRCCVVAVEDGKVDLSLRSSRTGEPEPAGSPVGPADSEVTGVEDLMEGQLVRGFTRAVTNAGNYIRYVHV